ncbi:MAG: transposase, partial [Verrucomicrobia bacterium]|nr:transposase [Verrucomicrobiota bacterium]
ITSPMLCPRSACRKMRILSSVLYLFPFISSGSFWSQTNSSPGAKKSSHVRPGRPVENGYIKSFNGKLRDECLNLHLFFSLADAEEKLAQWRREYNHERPHSALAGQPPAVLRSSAVSEHKPDDRSDRLLSFCGPVCGVRSNLSKTQPSSGSTFGSTSKVSTLGPQ